MMRVFRFSLSLAAAILGFSVSAWAQSDPAADADTTLVSMCSHMPETAVIAALSPDQAALVCRGMALLPEVRVKDIRTFSKCFVVLSRGGYEGSPETVAKQLTQIVKLRGLNRQPERWLPNLDLVVRAYQAFNGVVTPVDVLAFLAAAGPAAASLSDDGFRTMLAVIKEKKQGN